MSDSDLMSTHSGDSSDEEGGATRSGSKERWRASSAPVESFSDAEGANEDGEWMFQIIGEEVDETGHVLLEVRWDDWKRPDGTKTTWNEVGSLNAESWLRQQRQLRKAEANESLEIELFTTTDIHNTETHLRSQAYAEKLKIFDKMQQDAKRNKRTTHNRMMELAKLQAKRQDHAHSAAGTAQGHSQASSSSSSSIYPIRTNQRVSTRRQTERSLDASSSVARGSSKQSTRSSASLNTPSSSFTFQTLGIPPTSSASSRSTTAVEQPIRKTVRVTNSPQRVTPRKKVRRVVQSDSDEELENARLKSSLSPETRRLKIQNEWTQFAAREGAAPIHFINDVDDEPVPKLGREFRYLESKYQFAPGTHNRDLEDFIVGCTCNSCVDARNCQCLDLEQLTDAHGAPTFAYSSSGAFLFNAPRGTEVAECNKRCSCAALGPRRCVNRVSQRPRDVPIEVFKTVRRGWGVRPSNDVKKGKVLGLYTGLLVPRDYDADISQEDRSNYVFNLDGSVNEAEQLFSVDAKMHGNWTRFINHSCSPNLQVYLVLHDMPSGSNRPFIVFVAKEDIPSKTEFTVDYDPEAGEEHGRKQVAEQQHKGKRKRTASNSPLPDGTKPCMCGSEMCRGYLAC